MARVKRLIHLEEEFKSKFLIAKKEVFKGVDPEILKRSQDIGREIFVFEKLPRAMDFLKYLFFNPSPYIKGPLPNGTTVFARSLSNAKGRFGRKWDAAEGGLWLAIAIYDDFLPKVKKWFPILFGIGVAKAVRRLGVPAWVKWINDVHVNGKKLCGVLIEQFSYFQESWYFVGIGLNVNNSLPEGLQAISLSQILGYSVSLPIVFGNVLAEIARLYGTLKAYEAYILEMRYEEDFPFLNPIYEEFLAISDTLGKRVFFGYNLEEGYEEGVVKGISLNGSLIIHGKTGEIKFSTGEIIYIKN